ncbi:hypothetical protein QUB70_15415 [Microcoleus sp. A003_D6]
MGQNFDRAKLYADAGWASVGLPLGCGTAIAGRSNSAQLVTRQY